MRPVELRMRLIDLALRCGWMRWREGGYCDACMEEWENYYGPFLEGEDQYTGDEAEYANVHTEEQLCGRHFGIHVAWHYRIIEEVPIP